MRERGRERERGSKRGKQEEGRRALHFVAITLCRPIAASVTASVRRENNVHLTFTHIAPIDAEVYRRILTSSLVIRARILSSSETTCLRSLSLPLPLLPPTLRRLWCSERQHIPVREKSDGSATASENFSSGDETATTTATTRAPDHAAWYDMCSSFIPAHASLFPLFTHMITVA